MEKYKKIITKAEDIKIPEMIKNTFHAETMDKIQDLEKIRYKKVKEKKRLFIPGNKRYRLSIIFAGCCLLLCIIYSLFNENGSVIKPEMSSSVFAEGEIQGKSEEESNVIIYQSENNETTFYWIE